MNISMLLDFVSRHKWGILGGGLSIALAGILALFFFHDHIPLPVKFAIWVVVINSVVDPLALLLLQVWYERKVK